MEFVRSGKVKAAAKSAREGLEGSERDELKRAEAKRASLTCLAGADVAQGSRMERRVLSAPAGVSFCFAAPGNSAFKELIRARMSKKF